jgi:hypothetical protein
MNGDAAFMKLKEMTPEQRRECQFMWVFDRGNINNMLYTVIDDISFDLNLEDSEHDLLEKFSDELTPEEVEQITVNALDSVDDGIFYDFWDACIDCLRDQLRMTLEDKLEEHRNNRK